MSGVSVEQMAARVAELMEARLRVRGQGLAEKLRRGGRLLPRKVRREAEYLAQADTESRVPQLVMRLDHDRIAQAYDACIAYLRPLGATSRRKALFLDILTSFGFAIFASLVLVLALLYWRGFI